MVQVVASRSIQSTPLCLISGFAHDKTQNLLKPPSFASKVFPLVENNNKHSKLDLRSLQISARKSSPSEVIPMSPEDDPKVRAFCIFFEFLGDDSCDHFCVLVFILRSICHIYVGCSHLVRTLFECGLSQCYHRCLKACTKILSNQSPTCSSQRSQVTVNIQFWA